ncbi:hypothetical protein SAMN05661096_02784 [Marivirga sericea]|uniref:Outer membrane protein beta-barrel domain-containing protein n=1 Tax=Marivirga sericea TaxID=1028 RepID=A0A1X7KHY1_9BACT|nr:hypothetical protein [Marivirga sericea]SMG40637.1 hypothetical protein SAMN05661096_02784 [Marivirga sericea]
MNKALLIISMGCISFVCFAQENHSTKDSIVNDYKPLLLSYISLSSNFESYNSFDLGLMSSLGARTAIGGELGYIYNLQGLNQRIEDNWYTDVYGIKAYFYYRYFFQIDENYPYHSKTFIDIEPQFYWTSFKAERIAGYACNDQFGDCEYYRFYDSRVNRIVPGLNIKFGKVYDYDPFYITLFLGLGYRYIQEYSEMNEKSVLPEKIFDRKGDLSDLQTGGVIKLRLGLQLAYNLWK